MSFLLAVSGKGGVGKTTIASAVIARLIARKRTPVLAVDADPNSCLDGALGVKVDRAIGTMREETRTLASKGMTTGVAKQQMLEMSIAESLVEADDFDLIAMGRPEGPGCYCYANNVLKQAIGALSSKYPYVVLDNEAGLENLSRRIVQHVNVLILVADPSQRGIDTLTRLHALAREMGVTSDKLIILINRLRQPYVPQRVMALKEVLGAHAVIGLPDDKEVAMNAEDGKSIFDIPAGNSLFAGIDEMLDGVL